MANLDWELVAETASKLGVTKEALKKWRRPDRGIPPKWWMPLVEKSKGRIVVEGLKASKSESVR